MFAKVFGQIFDSSIAEDYNCRRMFMDLLVLADSDGVVDMTHEAISRRTNVPIEEVRKYIEELQRPDPTSRSKLYEGKRLVPIDRNREWGWQVVNYAHYRKIRDEECRRSYFRDIKRRQRKALRKNVQDKNVDTGGQVWTPASASASSSTSSYVPEKGESEGEGRNPRPKNLEEVNAFCQSLGLPDGSYFWNKWKGNGFRNAKEPMRDWKSVIRSWKDAGHCPSQKKTKIGFVKQPDPNQQRFEEEWEAEKKKRMTTK